MTLRAAFFAHCIGVGGADGFLASLVRRIDCEWSGGMIAAGGLPQAAGTTPGQFDRFEAASGGRVQRWFEARRQDLATPKLERIEYRPSITRAAIEAAAGADVVYSWGVVLNRAIRAAIKAPIIDVTQGADEWCEPIAKANVRFADWRVAVSEAVRDNVFEAEDRSAVQVIYNGIEPERSFPSFPNARDSIREAYGYTPEQRVVTIIQRMSPDKNAGAIVQAINELAVEQRVAAHLRAADVRAASVVRKMPADHVGLIMGSGTVDVESRLEELIQRFTDDGRIGWIRANWSHVGDVLAASDCFVLASDSEGWPLAPLEAMLARVPCVLSRSKAIQEMHAKFGEVAAFVPVRPSRSELAAAIKYATSAAFFPVAERAFRMVSNYFTMPTIAAQYESLFYAAADRWRFNSRVPAVAKYSGSRPVFDGR